MGSDVATSGGIGVSPTGMVGSDEGKADGRVAVMCVALGRCALPKRLSLLIKRKSLLPLEGYIP